MNIEIRRAAATDHALICDWNAALAEESEGLALDSRALSTGVRRVLEDAGLGRYFIAEVDGEAAGQLMLTYEWSDWRNGMLWWIQSVYTAQAHRGKGVFRALYRHIEALARADGGVCGIRLYVHDGNAGAIATYRRVGMAEGHYKVMESPIAPTRA